jgi:hypothetical protein
MGGAGATSIPSARTSLNFPAVREKRISLRENGVFPAKVGSISMTWVDLTAPPAAEFLGYRQGIGSGIWRNAGRLI